MKKKKEARQKGSFFNRIGLIDNSGFADQLKLIYGLGYNRILKGKNFDSFFRR